MKRFRSIIPLLLVIGLISAATPKAVLSQEINGDVDRYLKYIGSYERVETLPEDVRALASKAYSYYVKWHTDPAYLKKCLKTCEELIGLYPKNLCLDLVYCRAADVQMYLGELETSRRKKIKEFKKGLNYAKKAIKINPDGYWGPFLAFANQGRLCAAKGLLRCMFILGKMKEWKEDYMNIDPDRAQGWMAWGQFLHTTPGIGGGSVRESIGACQKAIELDPNFTRSYLELAYAYKKKRDYEKARDALNRLFAVKDPSLIPDYYGFDLPRAKELLEEIEGK